MSKKIYGNFVGAALLAAISIVPSDMLQAYWADAQSLMVERQEMIGDDDDDSADQEEAPAAAALSTQQIAIILERGIEG